MQLCCVCVELNSLKIEKKCQNGSSSNASPTGEEPRCQHVVQYFILKDFVSISSMCVCGCRSQMGPMLLCWGNSGISQLLLPSLEGTAPYKALTMRAMTTSGQ